MNLHSRIKIKDLRLKNIKWNQKEGSGIGQRQTLAVEVESKVGAEEEEEDTNYKFKTRDRSQNKLLLTGECSRGCGSETEPVAQPTYLFLSPFPRTFMQGNGCLNEKAGRGEADI